LAKPFSVFLNMYWARNTTVVDILGMYMLTNMVESVA